MDDVKIELKIDEQSLARDIQGLFSRFMAEAQKIAADIVERTLASMKGCD